MPGVSLRPGLRQSDSLELPKGPFEELATYTTAVAVQRDREELSAVLSCLPSLLIVRRHKMIGCKVFV